MDTASVIGSALACLTLAVGAYKWGHSRGSEFQSMKSLRDHVDRSISDLRDHVDSKFEEVEKKLSERVPRRTRDALAHRRLDELEASVREWRAGGDR